MSPSVVAYNRFMGGVDTINHLVKYVTGFAKRDHIVQILTLSYASISQNVPSGRVTFHVPFLGSYRWLHHLPYTK